MCMFCAALPVAAAFGAKFNADQLDKPISKITSAVLLLRVIASATYHTLRWQN